MKHWHKVCREGCQAPAYKQVSADPLDRIHERDRSGHTDNDWRAFLLSDRQVSKRSSAQRKGTQWATFYQKYSPQLCCNSNPIRACSQRGKRFEPKKPNTTRIACKTTPILVSARPWRYWINSTQKPDGAVCGQHRSSFKRTTHDDQDLSSSGHPDKQNNH